MSSYAGFGLQQWENPETMSRYRKLTTACLAAALALGLAACGGGGSSTPPATSSSSTPPATSNGDTKKPPVASACPGTDATSHAACVGEKKAAMDAAKAALDAAKADQNSTQAQIAAAQKAYDDAMKAHTDAVAASNKYAAMQPQGYDLTTLEAAVKKPSTLGGGIVATSATGDTVDGGKVTLTGDSAYAEASWPVGQLASFDESVWERGTNTVVIYTNKQANKPAKYTDYFPADGSAPTAAAVSSGFAWVPWAAADSGTAVTSAGVVTLKNTALGKKGRAKISIPSLSSAPHAIQPFQDNTATATVDERKLAGTFHGVAGTFACTADTCTATNDKDGNLTTLTTSGNGSWTFTPTDTDVSVPGVQTDADYLDFGYWVNASTVNGKQSYDAAAFYRGKSPSGGTTTGTDIAGLEGSATYTGGAAGLFTKTTHGSGVTSGGRFTADASLTANFGGNDVAPNDADKISGSITNFMDSEGNVIDPGWTLRLMTADIEVTATDATEGTFSGNTSAGGKWSGNLYGAVDSASTPDKLPSGVAGEFTGAFTNGNVMGAFGATKQ